MVTILSRPQSVKKYKCIDGLARPCSNSSAVTYKIGVSTNLRYAIYMFINHFNSALERYMLLKSFAEESLT